MFDSVIFLCLFLLSKLKEHAVNTRLWNPCTYIIGPIQWSRHCVKSNVFIFSFVCRLLFSFLDYPLLISLFYLERVVVNKKMTRPEPTETPATRNNFPTNTETKGGGGNHKNNKNNWRRKNSNLKSGEGPGAPDMTYEPFYPTVESGLSLVFVFYVLVFFKHSDNNTFKIVDVLCRKHLGRRKGTLPPVWKWRF